MCKPISRYQHQMKTTWRHLTLYSGAVIEIEKRQVIRRRGFKSMLKINTTSYLYITVQDIMAITMVQGA